MISRAISCPSRCTTTTSAGSGCTSNTSRPTAPTCPLDPAGGIPGHPLRPTLGVAPADLHAVGRPDLGHQHDRPHPRVPRRGDQRPAAVLRARQRRHRRRLAPILPPRRLPRPHRTPGRSGLCVRSSRDSQHRAHRLRPPHRLRRRQQLGGYAGGDRRHGWSGAQGGPPGVHGNDGVDRLEAFATTVAAGGATYEDIAANGGSAANIWSILLGLGSVIPKIIFIGGVRRRSSGPSRPQ